MDNSYKKRNIISGVLFGLGLVAFFDEAVFHKPLNWYHLVYSN